MATVGGTRFLTVAPLRPFSIAAAILSLAAPATAADPTPQELAAKLREALTGLHTIEMQYRETQTFNERTTTNEREWLKSGERIRLIAHPGDLPRGWWSFDGQHGHKVGYFPDRESEIREINKTSTPPSGLAMSMPADWLGMRLRGLPSEGLVDLLEQPQARVIAKESFGEMPAYRVDLGEHETEAQGAWTWTAVICPERDGLPVEITCEPAEGNPEGDRLRNLLGSVRFLVMDFHEVHDTALQRTRWLPQRMRIESKPSVLELEVSLSRVNHEVPRAAFVPEPQPGTELIDDTVPGDRKVRVYKPEVAIARQAADLANQVRPAAVSSAPTATATPPDNSWLKTIALWGGAFFLLTAAILYYLRSRQVS